MKQLKTTLLAALLAITLSIAPVQAEEIDGIEVAQVAVQIVLVIMVVKWAWCQLRPCTLHR